IFDDSNNQYAVVEVDVPSDQIGSLSSDTRDPDIFHSAYKYQGTVPSSWIRKIDVFTYAPDSSGVWTSQLINTISNPGYKTEETVGTLFYVPITLGHSKQEEGGTGSG